MREPDELDHGTCHQLLAAASTGRLALNDPQGPHVVPVNHTVVDGDVLIRSGEGRKREAAEPGQAASFQVDGVDADRGRGWSVLARGVLELVEETEQERGDGPQPMAGGDRPYLLRLRITSIDGRRLPALQLPPPGSGNTWFDRDASDLLG